MGGLLFKVAPNHSAACCLAFLNVRRLQDTLWRKPQVLEKFHPVSDSTVGSVEFSMNKSMVCTKQGVFKQKHTKQSYILIS
jgi:hypothetical protein